MSACLDEEGVVDLLHGTLAPAAREQIAGHLGNCASCRTLVAEMALTLSGPAQAGSDTAPLRAGATLGRYVIIAPVGSGAMGLIYAAYDRELGRKVALKLLRPGALEEGPARLLSARLRREAQALAQLTHPNVVAVHDVDTFEDRIFLAMEFVEGRTLGAWLRESRRGWREVVAAFAQAGEGLAAAHAAGLVHRDFKPDNVLIGADGRVRVTDFGLARAAGAQLPAAQRGPDAPALESALTENGALIGTPAYMAPEQLAGGVADALSDQFSFCVALHEALYGERPFAAAGPDGIAGAIRSGPRPPPRGRGVPRWLRRIVGRGLAAAPAGRWPSMRHLLQALHRGALLTPARLAVPALLAAAAGAVAWTLFFACTRAEAAWGAVWSAERQQAVHQAFARSGHAHSEAAFATVSGALEAFHAAWTSMHHEACTATRLRRDQSESLLDLRMRCLADRQRRAEALVRVLAAADGALVDHAAQAIDALPTLDLCANAAALTASSPLPADASKRARIAELEGSLADLGAIGEGQVAGGYQRAAESLAPLLAEARQLGYPPLVARLLVLRGRLEYLLDHVEASLATLHEAAAVALEAHDDASLADAWILAIHRAGTKLQHAEEGHRLARYAEAALARLGGDDEREATRLSSEAGVMVFVENKFDEARPILLRARELYVKARGPEYWQVANLDNTLGSAALEQGRGEEALALFRRGELLHLKNFGAQSPWLVSLLNNQGSTLALLGRFDEALVVLRRSLAIRQQIAPGGNDSWLRNRIAMALRGKGEFAAALEQDRLSEADLRRHVSPDFAGYAWAWEGQAADLLGLGRPKEAVLLLERALVRWGSEPADPFEPASLRLQLARALWDSGGDRARARSLGRLARDALAEAAREHGSWFRGMQAEAERWLAAHP